MFLDPRPGRARNCPQRFISASVWLRDEVRFTILENLNHTPRPGEEFVIVVSDAGVVMQPSFSAAQ